MSFTLANSTLDPYPFLIIFTLTNNALNPRTLRNSPGTLVVHGLVEQLQEVVGLGVRGAGHGRGGRGGGVAARDEHLEGRD